MKTAFQTFNQLVMNTSKAFQWVLIRLAAGSLLLVATTLQGQYDNTCPPGVPPPTCPFHQPGANGGNDIHSADHNDNCFECDGNRGGSGGDLANRPVKFVRVGNTLTTSTSWNGLTGIPQPGARGGGMATWNIIEPNLSLEVIDEPLGYQPGQGNGVRFQLFHRQEWKEVSKSYDSRIFGVGTNWYASWQGYMTDEGEDTYGAKVYPPGGRKMQYSLNGGTELSNYDTNTRLERETSGSTTTGFFLHYPDGAKDYYQQMETGYSVLKKIIDQAGREIVLNYDNTLWPTHARLLSLTDADGHSTSLSYTNTSHPNNVTGVTDPFNRTCTLQYDGSGRLTNIIDVVNIASGFKYSSDNWITNMLTPYGVTDFKYTMDDPGDPDIHFRPGNYINRAIEITLPNGGKHLYMYREESSKLNPSSMTDLLPNAYPDRPSTTNGVIFSFPNTFDNTDMTNRNTFHWGPLQYAKLSTGNMDNFTVADYRLAYLKHWLLDTSSSGTDGFVTSILSMVRQPSPNGTDDGQAVWYDYEGKSDPRFQGTQVLPRFVAMKLPDGTSRFTHYIFNDHGLPTQAISTYTRSDGQVDVRTNTFTYAANDLDVIRVVGPDNNFEAGYLYNASHQVLTFTNALLEKTTFTYNNDGQLTSIKTPAGLTTTNLYYPSGTYEGWLEKTIDLEIDRTNTFTYADGLLFSHTDERGLAVTNYYDALQRLTGQIFPDETTVSNKYHLLGGAGYPGGTGGTNILDLTSSKDRLGNWVYFEYDKERRLTRATNELGEDTSFVYCDCGALEYVTNEVDNVVHYSYDNLGRVTETDYADGSVTNHYNLLGQLVRSSDSAGNWTTNYYNNQGLVTTVSNALGRVQSTAYDIEDQVTTSTDATGATITYTYDALHRVLTTTHPDSGVERLGYSVLGLIRYTNQLGKVTAYAYDVARRKTYETNANTEITAFTYSPASDLLTLKDGEDQTTTWEYDAYGRVTNKIDAASTSILTYKYDANSRLTNRWSVAKGTTVYAYDAAGNLTNINYPASADVTLKYDAANRLTNMVDDAGTTVYGYTDAGRLAFEDGPWADDTVSQTYTNRRRSRLTLLQPNASPWTMDYGYDAAHRLKTVASPAGTFTNEYHAGLGSLTSPSPLIKRLLLANGAAITNDFDSVGRLTKTHLRSGGGTLLNKHDYEYNDGNQRTKQTRTDGSFVDYTYDNIGQLKTATGKESGGTTRLHEKLGYAYDAAGNLNYRTNNALVQTFTVDDLNHNQLDEGARSGTLTVAGASSSAATDVDVNTLAATLYGDNTFARAGFSLSDGNNTFTAIGSDSLGRSDTNAVTVWLPATPDYAYDSNGNLLSDGKRAFTYDDENQLTSVQVTNAWRSEFVYDGKMRRRIRREFTWSGDWVQTNEVRYVYDGNLVIQERNGLNLPLVAYTRGSDLSGTREGAGGIGGLLARTDQTTSKHACYHADGNGNVTALVDGLQGIAARYLYDPYGKVLSSSGPLAHDNLYRFSSKEAHDNSGLVYYLYRYYEPSLQRWLNRDPLGEAGFETARGRQRGIYASEVNLYAFIMNDPISSFDPLGLHGNPIPKIVQPQATYVCDQRFWEAADYNNAKDCANSEFGDHAKDNTLCGLLLGAGVVGGEKLAARPPARLGGWPSLAIIAGGIGAYVIFDNLCKSCVSGHWELVPGGGLIAIY